MDLFLKISGLQAFFLLAGRFGKNDMSFEGNCCWEVDNSGCTRGVDVENNCYVLTYGHTSAGKVSISLAGSEEQINFASNLPKCLKWLQKALFTLCFCWYFF